jgi:hypothetical protein
MTTTWQDQEAATRGAFREFAERAGIVAHVTQIPARTDGNGDAWNAKARHYVVMLTKGGNGTGKGPETGRLALQYSQGSGIKDHPTRTDILNCLASDYTEDPFESWASESGYDTDSRKALATYEAVRTHSVQLAALLGPSLLADLLDLERL